MRALDRKLLRDLMRIWPQGLAIALVVAAGVATLILAVGAYRSLDETRRAYYERHRFADIFASVSRAPRTILTDISSIDGVLSVEPRIVDHAILDIDDTVTPVTSVVISLPDHHPQRLNILYLRSGRLPEAGNDHEAVVNEAFANAHRLVIGSAFSAVLNGRKRQLRVVGVALSPEYVYAIGPGDLMPDDRRFAVVWMSESALAAAYDLEGAFNSLLVKLINGTRAEAVVDRIDRLTARYGGTGATLRKDQTSDAFLDAELKQLNAMARIIPPIFLLVSAFLINMTLSRLIALEREQIGLLKALGYGRLRIAVHYLELVLAIAAVGIVIGYALGTWFGLSLTRLYAEFFHFPFLIFERSIDLYLLAGGLSAAAASVGGLRSVWKAASLAPAVAMQPPAPARYKPMRIERLGMLQGLSQLTMMSLRHMVRMPARAAMTGLGLSLGAALLIVSLFSVDSVEHMIDVNFFLAQRQDATLNFATARDIRVTDDVRRLPGVLRVEPFRSVLVRLRNGQRDRKIAIQGLPADRDLARIIDRSLAPVLLSGGLVIDERVAEVLALAPGDLVEVEPLEGRRRTRELRLAAIIRSDFGLSAYMPMRELNQLMAEGRWISGTHISYDRTLENQLFEAVKSTPAIASIALHRFALAKFRETIARNIDIMVGIYLSLAVIVAFGVAYNAARIQLSEQARELASLRVLGFTRGEVSHVLFLELAVLTLLSQPLGWLLGYGFGWLVISGFSSDLYRTPMVIHAATYARASLVVFAAVAVAALIVRLRINRLDLMRVLKTRD
ncbi:MAG: ABC transporter permease [Hyphomicrobiaceae bacterium]